MTEQSHAQLAVLVACRKNATSLWPKAASMVLSKNLTDLSSLRRRTSVSRNVYERGSPNRLTMCTVPRYSLRRIVPQPAEALPEYARGLPVQSRSLDIRILPKPSTSEVRVWQVSSQMYVFASSSKNYSSNSSLPNCRSTFSLSTISCPEEQTSTLRKTAHNLILLQPCGRRIRKLASQHC